MRLVKWGDPIHYDDPNLYWGNPSYLLEPGDAGYVADPTSASFPPTSPQTRKKHMPRSNYLKSGDLEFSQQLQTFKNNVGPYTALLGLSAGQVSAQAADADRFAYELACQEICGNCAQQWTAWKEITRNGGTPPAAGAPLAPALPTLVPAVAPGIEPRFRALVQLLTASGNYSVATGEILGTEGPLLSGPDFATFGPKLKLRLSGGLVLVGWGWQNQRAFLDMIEILVDRGDGQGYKVLAYDTTPDYLDTTPLPATPAKWKYKAIYRVADARVGQWSDEVSITVAA